MVTERSIFLFIVNDGSLQLDILNSFGNTHATVQYVSY
jgi:hypothetical protein